MVSGEDFATLFMTLNEQNNFRALVIGRLSDVFSCVVDAGWEYCHNVGTQGIL